ncbi:MAG: prenyltransferase/squalene oxidase repeat-containing protein, partial [bacterium]
MIIPARDFQQLDAMYSALAGQLLAARAPDASWRGRLSDSALATATAIAALAALDRRRYAVAIAGGRAWLAANVNCDGGWGDTPSARSNISTTLIVLSALRATGTPAIHSCEVASAAGNVWLLRVAGGLDAAALSAALAKRYGGDRTFAAPILALADCCGSLDGNPAWLGPQLPFALAALPQWLFRWLRLPVVSYALPALIAVGLYQWHRRGRGGAQSPFVPAVLRRLNRLQPASGGYLEAVPLTAFVVLCLAASGYGGQPAAQRGADFLIATRRDDGAWPIDVDLSTWVTTLAVQGLCEPGGVAMNAEMSRTCTDVRDILLARQWQVRHPFTGATAGGWGWTDHDGAVPDVDDTAGALLALHALGAGNSSSQAAAMRGAGWLLDLQNRDGGWPTFCRGWGRWPFDRSCPDLTAHALRALRVWRTVLPASLAGRLARAQRRGIIYLKDRQGADGSWTPLWFGCETAPDAANPTYGTARVVLGLRELAGEAGAVDGMLIAGERWLCAAQAPDGGWGGAAGCFPTLEETSWAVEALAGTPDKAAQDAVQRGIIWIENATAGGQRLPLPSTIGYYFSSLWYEEAIY